MKERNKIKEISVNIIEGKNPEGPKTFTTLGKANSHIFNNERDFSTMGYCKMDIVITWVDGSVYKFRLDGHHPDNEYYTLWGNTIDANIRSAITFYTNPEKLTWVEDNMREESIKFFSDLRDNYQIS